MKYIITGGLGFIGSNIIKKIKKIKKNYLIIDYIEDNKHHDNFININIRDKNIEKYFDEGDIVIHLAGISSLPLCQSDPSTAFDINVSGTLNILEICRRKKIKKIIFASSSTVYENTKNFPSKEEDEELNPNLIYSISKLTCENLCKSFNHNYGMGINIIRFFNIYGGNQNIIRKNPPLTAYIMKCMHQGISPILQYDGSQRRDYLYIDDLVELILKLSDSEVYGEIFNACSGKSYSVNEILKIIKKEMETNINPEYSLNLWDKHETIISGNNPIKKEIILKEIKKFTLGDNKKAKEILGWEPKITLEKGLKILVENFKKKILTK